MEENDRAWITVFLAGRNSEMVHEKKFEVSISDNERGYMRENLRCRISEMTQEDTPIVFLSTVKDLTYKPYYSHTLMLFLIDFTNLYFFKKTESREYLVFG